MKRRSGIPANVLDWVWSTLVALGALLFVRQRMLYLDIGARDGVSRRWRFLHAVGKADIVMVEPDAKEADRLQRAFPNMLIICAALGENDEEQAELKIARRPGLSSLLEPAMSVLPAKLRARHEIVERLPLTLRRLDAVWDSRLGAPTFVKVDVQGYELTVLKGFGDLLASVVGIEVEVRIPKHYEGQSTIEEINSFMVEHGFDLVKLVPNGFKEGRYLAVFNAFYLRHSARGLQTGRLWRILSRIRSQRHFLRWTF